MAPVDFGFSITFVESSTPSGEMYCAKEKNTALRWGMTAAVKFNP
jgi:hypothetical protein